MANDRLYMRCKVCGDYACIGKYYPGSPGTVDNYSQVGEFLNHHLEHCQPQGQSFEGEICIVFDSEETFCDAGGFIGGKSNINLDREYGSVAQLMRGGY